MNTRSRLGLLVALLTALLLAVLPVAAQDNFGLSDEDAALLDDALAASSQFETLSFNFYVNMQITGLDEMPETAVNLDGSFVMGWDEQSNPAGAITLAAVTNGTTADYELRLVDGTVYFSDSRYWYSFSLDAVLGAIGEQMGMTLDYDMLLSGELLAMVSELSPESGQMIDDVLAALSSEIDLTNYIQMERLADDGTIAEFSTEITLGNLLTSMELGEAVMSLSDTLDDATLAQVQAIVPMFPLLIDRADISLSQFVDTELGLLSGTALTVDVAITTGMLVGDPEAEPETFHLEVDVSINEYDPVVTVEAPTGVNITDITGDIIAALENMGDHLSADPGG